ncbi:MAG: hypothetical protein WED10_07440 [Brumimicrobium sp.]
MKHRGEIIEAAVRQSGISISELARRIGKSRRHLYNIFEHPQVSIDVVLQIGKAIHYDFGKDIPEIKPSSETNRTHVYENDESVAYQNKSIEYWKNKYLLLLEKYNELLEKK